MTWKILSDYERQFAAARVLNYLEDNGIEVADFARAIGRSPATLKRFLNYDGANSIGAPALHCIADKMGITYSKLISPLTDADYGGVSRG